VSVPDDLYLSRHQEPTPLCKRLTLGLVMWFCQTSSTAFQLQFPRGPRPWQKKHCRSVFAKPSLGHRLTRSRTRYVIMYVSWYKIKEGSLLWEVQLLWGSPGTRLKRVSPSPLHQGLVTCWVHYVMRGMGSHSTTVQDQRGLRSLWGVQPVWG
jgi:hypothetical protein